MSQYYARIHIKVTSPGIWRKFQDRDDAGFDLAELEDIDTTSYVYDSDWSCDENELSGIVNALAKTLGKEGIIIADTTNINIDPYNYCMYYFGYKIYTDEFSYDFFGKDKCNMHEETNIGDIPGWLNYGEFSATEKEMDLLFKCGITYIDGLYEEFTNKVDLPSKIYLRETGFEERPSTIEESFVSEEVYFVHSSDKYDSMRLEAMGVHGSLGYLPSDVSDQITPFLLKERMEYTAKIVEIVKLSKRNKHAKSPIIAINIDARIVDYKVPVKDSVPEIDRKALEYIELKQNDEKYRRINEENEEAVERVNEEKLVKEECERKAVEEAARRAEQEKLAREEAERKAAEEAARRAEEEKLVRKEAEHKAAEEAARKAEQEKLAREEVERKATEEAERKKEEERKNNEIKEILDKYFDECSQWNEKCEIIRVKREYELIVRLKKEKDDMENIIRLKRETKLKEANSKLAELTKVKTDAEITMASLAFFQIGRKKELKNIIENASSKISEIELEKKNIEIIYDREMSEVPSRIESFKEKIRSEVEKDLVFPDEPEKPSVLQDYSIKTK